MTLTTPTDTVAERYEPLVVTARERFFASPTVQTLTDPSTDADVLDAFLVHFCALGTQMTRPVDDWIRRAGAACVDTGFVDLGRALERHAEHEAGHDQMMVVDTHSLVTRWNAARPDRPFDASALLDRTPTRGVQRYVELHEGVIAGSRPFTQIAVEYEIELLSVTAGPLLMGNVAAVCGEDRIRSLSFLTDHIAIDEGHTAFNRRQLNAFLDEHPQTASALGATGACALEIYRAFLDDCLTLATLHVG